MRRAFALAALAALLPASAFAAGGPLLSSAAAGGFCVASSPTIYESIRYQPRRYQPYYRERRGYGSGVTQLHIGVFDPKDFSSAGAVFGFRGGTAIDQHIQLGVAVDWRYKSDRQTEVVSSQSLPGGGTAQVTRVLSRASSNFVPIMGYVQVGGSPDLAISPYIGAGAGWEGYWISADDFNSGTSFDASYGGFGWQAWAGAQMALGPRSHLIGEVFINQAELGRDVNQGGQTFRETINLDGTGARFGVSWGF